MGKTIKKRSSTNALLAEKLAEKYGFTKQFVNKAVMGKNTSVTAQTILKEYNELLLKVDSIFK